MASQAPVLDTGDIQADVILGVNMKTYLLVVYLDIEDKDEAQAWLREILPQVTTADAMRDFRARFREARRGAKKPVLAGSATLNVSFSYAGLAMLEAPDVEKFQGPKGFGTAFSVGLEQRAASLGDVVAGCPPSSWITGSRTPHILLQAGTDSEAEFQVLKKRYSEGRGVKVLHVDTAHRLDSIGSEQFGFHDAVSNPALRGFFSDGRTPLSRDTHPEDTDHGLPGQDMVFPGEFVLLRDKETDSVWTEGLAGDGGARQASPETWTTKYSSYLPDWAANGAFLVNRRLRQDVAGFWAWCDAEAKKSGDFTQEAVAAKLFGRWPSGCPLARSPDEDIEEIGADGKANNAYAFACPNQIRTAARDSYPKATTVDIDGKICPLAAHTRKMNPRDGINDSSSPLIRRIMRRGLPYGPTMDDPRAGVDDGQDRGLQFVAYCSSIEEQFEFLQKRWANSAHSPTDPTDVDPIIGQVAPGASKPFHFTDSNGQDQVVDPKGAGRGGASQFVAPTGGGYFFTPSITALTMLSSSAKLAKDTFMYNFPGELEDLPESARPAWSDAVQGFFESTIKYSGDLYFTLCDDPDAVPLGTRRITWGGFAHKFVVRYASDREVFEAADELQTGDVFAQPDILTTTDPARRERCGGGAREGLRNVSRQMDEYCEWYATKENGKIVQLDVTTELPEYWNYMYTVAPDTVLALYQQYISPDVKMEDLLDSSGSYDKYNKWNTQQGCMHLQQPEDTASAAVGITGSSTKQLVDDQGRRISGKQKLMEAHGTGTGSSSPLRGSDPSITQDMYELCAPGRGAKVTLADPIGVYMDDIDVSGWAAPDGTPLDRDQVVTLARGKPGAALRYTVRVPDGAGYVLGDCFVAGQPVQFGGQLVKNAITCYLTVGTYKAPVAPLPARRCPYAEAITAVPVKDDPVKDVDLLPAGGESDETPQQGSLRRLCCWKAKNDA